MDSLLITLFPFVDFLYILQLEDYNTRMYLRWINPRLFSRDLQKVGHISWTRKAQMLLGLALFIYFIATVYIAVLIPAWWWLAITIIITTFSIPYFVAVANLAFAPFDIILKNRLKARAAQKLRSMPQLKIIAITGSQGKTTVRNFVVQILEGAKKVHTPPANHNVFTSISEDILHNLTGDTEIYVVEFGELYKGDLTYLQRFLQPKAIVITAINNQHVAQFGSQSTIDGEFIAMIHQAKDAEIFVNATDAGVERIKKSIDRSLYDYSASDSQAMPAELQAPHMQQNAAAAVAVAEWLGMSKDHIAKRLAKLQAPERRMRVEKHGDITIIDDSYNINPDSAAAALEYLKKHAGRKVVVTGGIVDQGSNEAEANKAYGTLLAEMADVIIVADNTLRRSIEKGIGEGKHTPEIHISGHPDETPGILKKVLKPGDCVLVQNELPDLYWH